jgi:hypothetical protein
MNDLFGWGRFLGLSGAFLKRPKDDAPEKYADRVDKAGDGPSLPEVSIPNGFAQRPIARQFHLSRFKKSIQI